MSNAERQKRYRDSKRNAQPGQNVTEAPPNVTRVTVEGCESPKRNAPPVILDEHEQRTRTVPIPGDPDYAGCCKLVAGVWQEDNTTSSVKAMPTDELIRRLYYIKDWQHRPEHQEVLRKHREATA